MLRYIILILLVFSFYCFSKLQANTGTSLPNSSNCFYSLLSDQYYYWNNGNILNIAPYLSLNGLDNRNLNFFINGINYNFLNLPLSSSTFINPFFISLGDKSNSGLIVKNSETNINLISGREIFSFRNKSTGYVINTSATYPNLNTNDNALAYFHTNKANILLGINYVYFRNAFEHNFQEVNSFPMNEYSTILVAEYTPNEDNNTLLKLTNINSFSSSCRDISNNENAMVFFNHNTLHQKAINSLTQILYQSKEPDNLLWDYNASFSFGSQSLNINKNDALVNLPTIAYDELNYKVQNISKLILFSNNLTFTYGVNLNRVITNNYSSTNNSLWVKGKEDNVKLYVQGDIDLLQTDIIHILPKVTLNYEKYKEAGFNSYNQKCILPAIGLSLKALTNLYLLGEYRYNKKLPHIYEKYLNGSYFYNDYFVKFVPNLDLKEEESSTFNIGVKYNSFHEDSSIKLNAESNIFISKINNYIDYNFITKDEIQFINGYKGNFIGFNIKGLLQIYNWNISLYYAYINGKDEENNYLNNLYPNKFILNTSYDFSIIKLKPGIKIRSYSSFNKFSKNYPYLNNKISGYTLYDVYLEYRTLTFPLYLTVGVDNILNKKYNRPYIVSDYKDRTYYFNLTLKL